VTLISDAALIAEGLEAAGQLIRLGVPVFVCDMRPDGTLVSGLLT
jgi:hypothetical protein